MKPHWSSLTGPAAEQFAGCCGGAGATVTATPTTHGGLGANYWSTRWRDGAVLTVKRRTETNRTRQPSCHGMAIAKHPN